MDRKCCEDISKIENYEKAKTDNFKGWLIHHRLETHTSDGEKRKVDLLAEELKALNMYWHRPANELIFLTRAEHASLHNNGRKYGTQSEEHRKKNAEAHKGKHHTEEWKKENSERMKGHSVSEETRKKLSNSLKGKLKGLHWKLVDGKRVWY